MGRNTQIKRKAGQRAGAQQGRTTGDIHGRQRQDTSIVQLLQWAFADECASVDFEDAGTLAQGYGATGNAHRMVQHRLLGGRIEGGGRSSPDADADLVASAVAVLPEGCGGRQMATQIAALSRLRMVPDTAIGRATTCQPVKWQGNRHGRQGKAIAIGRCRDIVGGQVRSIDVMVVPVVCDVDVQHAATLQRNYLQWWSALNDLRRTFQIHNNLSRWQVTDAMPPQRPWNKCLVK